MANHTGELRNLLERLILIEVAVLADLRAAQVEASRGDGDANDQTLLQAYGALHREVSEAVKELADAAAAAKRAARAQR